MRYPSPAYRPPETEEKHWDRWNRRPRPSQRYPAHYARAPRIPSSSISSGPSISRDPNVRIPSKVSSKTLVPESSTPSCRADSKGRQSGNSIVGSKERYSSKSSDTRLVSPDLRTPSAKFHAPESSPHSSATLPSTPESEAPPDQVEVALSKLSVADEESQTKFQRIVDGIKWLLLDQWFLLVFALLVIIASQKQVSTPAAQQIKQTITSYLCVSVIFFITGCTLPTKILVENYKRWKVHLVVQGQGFLMTSAVTFGIVCALNKSSIFDPYAGFKNRPKDPTPSWLLVGMLFMGCVPTSISSNVVLTEQAHGNMAFTVVQSTIGNFMAPFLTPLLMNMYTGPTSPFPLGSAIPQRDNYAMLYGRVFKQLGLSVFLPMVSAFLCFLPHLRAQCHVDDQGLTILNTDPWTNRPKSFPRQNQAGVEEVEVLQIKFYQLVGYSLANGGSGLLGTKLLPQPVACPHNQAQPDCHSLHHLSGTFPILAGYRFRHLHPLVAARRYHCRLLLHPRQNTVPWRAALHCHVRWSVSAATKLDPDSARHLPGTPDRRWQLAHVGLPTLDRSAREEAQARGQPARQLLLGRRGRWRCRKGRRAHLRGGPGVCRPSHESLAKEHDERIRRNSQSISHYLGHHGEASRRNIMASHH